LALLRGEKKYPEKYFYRLNCRILRQGLGRKKEEGRRKKEEGRRGFKVPSL
jgi:hypothetical protein